MYSLAILLAVVMASRALGLGRPKLGDPCPIDISISGPDWRNWTFYVDVGALLLCNHRPKIISIPISVEESSRPVRRRARACVSYQGDDFDVMTLWNGEDGFGGDLMHQVDVQVGWADTDRDVIMPQALTAARELQEFLVQDPISKTIFVHYGNTAVGIYIGPNINTLVFAYQTVR
jgi:hypothetical protein